MSALDGFYTTWDNARNTFGEGTPQGGSQIDASAKLRQAGTNVQSAAPGDAWSGSASDAYGAANTKHGQNLNTLAELDQKLGSKLDEAADVVTTGRSNLDSVRQWVTDAASTVPEGKQRDTMLMQIANKGLGQVSDIVQTSNDANNTISDNINNLTPEYDAVNYEQEEGEGDKDGEEGQPSEEEIKRRVEDDVRNMLESGDPQATARVEQALGPIVPGEKLSPEQNAYLTQMAELQGDMSVDDLLTSYEKLGDHQNVLGNSWQLMSNDDVRFGEPDDSGSIPPGSFDRLPPSVQQALSTPNFDGPNGHLEKQQVEHIADIVRAGDEKFQTGTEIDREMIRLSDRLMDQGPETQETVRELFTSAGRDHQVVTDHMVGHQPYLDTTPGTVPYDYNSDDFLRDVMTTGWSDDGKDAASLFNWTNEASTGPDSDIASAAAERYANFIGAEKDKLVDMPNMFGMTDTVGQVNPEIVQGMAHGLTPYMADIAGVAGGADDNFQPLETDSHRPIAKGIFAVLGTDADAYREFYGAANQLALEKTHDWATAVKEGGAYTAADDRMLAAATLKGLIDDGTAQGLRTIGLDNQEMTDLKKSVYDEAVSALSKGPYGAAFEKLGGALGDDFFGDGSDIHSGKAEPMLEYEAARFAVDALIATGAEVPGTEAYLVEESDSRGNTYQRTGSLEELHEEGRRATDDVYARDVIGSLNERLGGTDGESDRNPAKYFADRYDDIIA